MTLSLAGKKGRVYWLCLFLFIHQNPYVCVFLYFSFFLFTDGTGATRFGTDLRRVNREEHPEAGPLADLAFDLNLEAMGFSYLFDDGEADPRRGAVVFESLLGVVILLEDFRNFFVRDADTLVAHFKEDLAGRLFPAPRPRAPRLLCVSR